MKKIVFLSLIIHLSFLNFAFSQVASETEMVKPSKVGSEDMLEVRGEDIIPGDYEIAVESSSSMFRISRALLHVKDGKMIASLTLAGKGYTKLFPGRGEEASLAGGKGEILPGSDEKGYMVFDFPLSSLNKALPCAAFSKRKAKWYDRDILFDASSLPEDKILVSPKAEEINLKNGTYYMNVSLTGGSGRSNVNSPVKVLVKDKKAWAYIEWSSPNYDYMKVNGKIFDADKKILEKGGNSKFQIPVYSLDKKLPVIADTTAMSKSHEIQYWLLFDSKSAKKSWKPW
ncbi:MAG: hypothetical protein K5873_01295 [Treponema sp.]|nr:hypothetical protein [Treponema sp.]